MESIYDLIGIGIGPFNLGLAALTAAIPELRCIFFDQNPEFSWHAGLMIEGARLQVPFLADLVTLADPGSPFSYLSFLHASKRLFRFAISENYIPTRREYNQYGQWVVGRLSNLHFGRRCEAVHFNHSKNCYEVHVRNTGTNELSVFHAKHLVIGVGTVPNLPDCVKDIKNPNIIHSSDYLFHKAEILRSGSVTVVGSGQSAAEIFYDLLQEEGSGIFLDWFTRANRFYPMEYSKLTLEMSSPDYIEYFFDLSREKKKETLRDQDMLYKGINFSLIGAIYDELNRQSQHGSYTKKRLHTHCSLNGVSTDPAGYLVLQFYQQMQEKNFNHDTGFLILATGYSNFVPAFLEPVKERIQWTADDLYDINRNYSIDRSNSLFVQNADLHSHGFNSADLGMGACRNAIIINTILGREHFKVEKQVAFQTFGIPS